MPIIFSTKDLVESKHLTIFALSNLKNQILMDVKTRRKPKTCINGRCESLADKIMSFPKDRVMIVRALKDLFLDARSEGYMQHLKDASAFKKAREKHMRDDWFLQKTAIDDLIHTKKQ